MSRPLVGPNDEPVTPRHACDRCGARYHGRDAATACCSDTVADGGEVEEVETTGVVDESERKRVRTRERVETTVETVEEEEYRCPVCEQWYEEVEMVPVGLGVDEDAEMPAHRAYHDEDQLCGGCAESLFDYDGPSGLFDYAATEWQAVDYRDLLSGAASLSLGVGAAGLLLHGFGYVLDSMNSLSADAAADTPAMQPFADLFGAMGPAFAIMTVVIALVWMPRIFRGGRI